jgi:hypothetical protein
VVHGEKAAPLTKPFEASRTEAERSLDTYNPVGFNEVFQDIRLQTSTVTRSPWVDLPEQGGGE